MANTTTQFNIKINGIDQVKTLNQVLAITDDTLGDLKIKQQALSQAFEQADFGTQEFKALQSELQNVNTQLKVIDESVSDLTIAEKFEGINRVVGAAAGVFAFATTSVQAFGDENSKTAEEIQKLQLQITAVIQGTQTLQLLTEAFSSKNKIFTSVLNNLSLAFNRAGLSAKLFGTTTRIALTTTGIGALVVGIGLLIANFDKVSAKLSSIGKSLEPVLDSLRDIGNVLTFGLIDDANVSKLKDSISTVQKSIEKSNEDSTAKLKALSTDFSTGLIGNLGVLKDELRSLNEATVATSNVISGENQKTINQVIEGVRKAQRDIALDLENFDEGLLTTLFGSEEDRVKIKNDLIRIDELQSKLNSKGSKFQQFDGFNFDAERALENLSEQVKVLQEIRDLRAKFLETTNKQSSTDETILALNEQIAKQTTFILEQETKITANKVEQLKAQAEISKRQIALSNLKTDAKSNDLTNFKEILDLITNQPQIFIDKLFGTDSAVRNKLKAQVEILKGTLDSNELKKAIDNIFITGSDFFSGSNIVKAFDLIKTKAKQQSEERIKNLNAEAQVEIKLANDILKVKNEAIDNNPSLTNDQKKSQKGLNSQEVSSSNANILQKAKNDADAARDSVIKFNAELNKTEDELRSRVRKGRFSDEEQDIARALDAIDKFKAGVLLTQDELDVVSKEFKKNLNFNINDLPFSKQIEVINELSKLQKTSFEDRKKEQKELLSLGDDENALNTELKASIQGVTDKTNELTKAILEQKKAIIDNLDVAERQNQAFSAQNTLDNPQSSYSAKADAIKKLSSLEKEEIQKTFELRTKNLEATDERTLAALDERQLAEQEADKKLAQSLKNLYDQRTQQVLANIQTVIGSLNSAAGSVFDLFIQRNQVAQQNLQDEATALNESLATIQDQINSLDGIINERKAVLAELENKAAEATGGQREEIFNKIEKEIELTSALVDQKNDQVKAEKALQAQLSANAKEQAKFQKEAITLQKQQAVVSGILATSQAALAIAELAASNAKKDITFGIATVAGVIALGAALVATISSIRNLAEGGFISKAEGGEIDPYGYTNTLGVSSNADHTGERPTKRLVQLHSDEYVVPRRLTNSAKWGPIVQQMENDRVKGMASGGVVQSPDKSFNTVLNAERQSAPIYVAVTDINEGQSKVKVIESRSKI